MFVGKKRILNENDVYIIVNRQISFLTNTFEIMTTVGLNSPPVRMIQNFYLVWLDENIDENNDDWHNSVRKLHEVVNTVYTFIDIDDCIDLITDMPEETTFMIISENFRRKIASFIQSISQVSSVYIYDENNNTNEQTTGPSTKIKGVFSDFTLIYEALKRDIYRFDHNSIGISFFKNDNIILNRNLNELDPTFMYTQILKEILLTIKFEQEHIDQFLNYCREQFVDSVTNLKTVDKIEKEYTKHNSIWWYTSDTYLYSMLNRALRDMDVDLIVKIGFLLCDLHRDIAPLHAQQFSEPSCLKTFTVYRGQALSQSKFDQLKNTKGGLLSFNNFLSTSVNHSVGYFFAESNQANSDLVTVLFEITVNPSIYATLFANVKAVSYFQGGDEAEILFSMHSVFRIGEVREFHENPHIYQVNLTLTSDDDPQLRDLTEWMQVETSSGSHGWDRLTQLMIKLGQFDKAEEFHDVILKQTTDPDEKVYLCEELGIIKQGQGKYEEALVLFEKTFHSRQKTLPADHPDLAISYHHIGSVYSRMNEYTKTLEYYNKALQVWQNNPPENQCDLPSLYNNMGTVYDNKGEYPKAIEYYSKALEIYQNILPSNHPNLVASYNNIGLVYDRMGKYFRTLKYYQRASEIFRKILPDNHTDLALSYNNIGFVYEKLNEYTEAQKYYEKALKIFGKNLSGDHPYWIILYNNIGSVHHRIGEYPNALEYYEKALQICHKICHGNHPDLAISYNNIASVYEKMGDYAKALEYYDKASDIHQKTGRASHPELVAFYNNVGFVHENMGDDSKALTCYEKALEICHETLSEDHPNLIICYNNIGSVYERQDDFCEALKCYEKALDIGRKTLPENSARLADSYNNAGLAYNRSDEHLKALESYEKALEILQNILPVNHPDLATSYSNIGSVYHSTGQYSEALEYYGKALAIWRETFPTDHPRLATFYMNIAAVYYQKEEYPQSLTYFQRALDIFQRSLPSDHPYIKAAKNSIEAICDQL